MFQNILDLRWGISLLETDFSQLQVKYLKLFPNTIFCDRLSLKSICPYLIRPCLSSPSFTFRTYLHFPFHLPLTQNTLCIFLIEFLDKILIPPTPNKIL